MPPEWLTRVAGMKQAMQGVLTIALRIIETAHAPTKNAALFGSTVAAD